MVRLRSFLSLSLLLLLPLSAPAQSVDAVVEQMRNRYEQQLEAVDTYIVETNLYTSYSKKVMDGGEPTYETQTKMKGGAGSSLSDVATPATGHGLHLDRLQEHASYGGTASVGGSSSHVLRVEDASDINPNAGQGTHGMTYYIDAEQYVPVRMTVETEGQGRGPAGNSRTVTINMSNYQTTDGLTLPHRMEIQFDLDMSEQQRKQMKQAMAKMENMPEQQRKQMQNMMGGRMEMMKQMMSGEPMVVEVQDVQVNVELPEEYR